MKICMVTLDNPAHHLKDGIAISVNELSLALSELGHEVWIIGFDKEVEKEEIIEKDGVKYWCLPNRGSSLVSRMVYFMKDIPKKLEQLNKDESIDIFHGHGGYAGPIAKARLSKSKRVITMHTTSEEDFVTLRDLYKSKLYLQFLKKIFAPPLPLLKLWRKWYFNKMDKIISISKHNVSVTVKELKVPEDRFVVIPNGVNYEKLHEIKSSTKIEYKNNTILYYGRLAPRKGVQVLLRSIPMLLKEYSSLKVNIVGDGEYLSVVKQLSNDLNIGEKVNFMGFLHRNAVTREVVESTIVVIPSLYEGLPLTLLESMALGKPIVASKLPGICEVLKDKETGIIVEPNDPLSLAEGIKILLSNPETGRRIGKNAEDAVKMRYTWTSIARRVSRIYGEIINA